MSRSRIGLCVGLLLFGCAVSVWAQQPTATASNNSTAVVPPLVSFSGVLTDVNNKPLTTVVGVTFALYRDSQGGAPLWLETQNVYPDKTGHYTVLLGSTTSAGLPADLFVAGEARWLGVQAQGEAEQPRVSLTSAPYALKAADAQTVGGLPASAFVLAAPPVSSAAPATSNNGGTTTAAAPAASSNVTTTGGTANTIPMFTTATNIQNSILTQTGTTAINVGGKLNLAPTGTATATKAYNSQSNNYTASVFNSGTGAAVNEKFLFETEPVGNNTTTPSGSLHLLFGSGANAPVETGIKIAANGLITFATGQTFPGAGTITGVTAGTDLTGGGTSGSITLNLDTTKVPQLATANTFTGNQTVNGNVSATGLVTGTAFNIGSKLFAFGSYANGNVLLGFAGNSTMTGTFNTASGENALYSNTSGGTNTANGDNALYNNTTGTANTAIGAAALLSNTSGFDNTATGEGALADATTGNSNTAIGQAALQNNTTGSSNTALGYEAGPDQNYPSLTNSTAIGANADVTKSNALVLGSINGVNGATASTNVGIGTTAPQYALDVHGTGNFTGLVNFASGQTFPGTGTITGVTAGTGLSGGGTSGSVTLSNTGILSLTQGTGISVSSGQTPTIAINTSVVPLLAAANTFTGNQTVNGNLSATGVVTGSSYQIGGNLFAFGSYANQNAFLGFAGNTTTTGVNNTASGYQALFSNTTGVNNTASGYQALFSNTSSSNTADGYQALYSNTTGYDNTASGVGALDSNTTGYYNTASGASALYYNTTGYENTAVGVNALLYSNTGYENTASGVSALLYNTTGAYNTASGASALYSNIGDSAQDGWFNTAVGAGALYANNDTSGTGSLASRNTAIGYKALYSNTTGSQSIASGEAALYSNTTGYQNTSVGVSALFSNTTGYDNTAVGFDALSTITTGSDLTCVGYACTAAAADLKNATAIGAYAVVGQSNSLVLGGTGEWGVNVGIGTTTPSNILTIGRGLGHPVSDSWETYSSRRWKTNIHTLHGALGKVEQLRGVSYDLKDSGKHEIGVIAEEVGAVVPEVVTYEKNGKDAQGVDYGRLTALLIEATKEQRALIHQQQLEITRLRSQVKAIQAALKTNDRTGSEVRRVKAQTAAPETSK